MKYMLVTFLLVLPFLGQCQPEDDKGWAPVARFVIDPLYVPKGVDTEITLDARRSCDALDNPKLCDTTEDGAGAPNTCPGGIEYSWDIPGAVGQISPVTSSYSLITVNVHLDTPALVTLTVTDCDGLSSTKSAMLGISD